MADHDPRDVLHVPCRLAYGCTDLTLAWPHGGTGLGIISKPVLRRYAAEWPVTSEAQGGIPVEYLEAGEAWGVRGILRTLTDDVVGKVFPNTSAGDVSQRKVVAATTSGTVRAGNWMSSRSFVLVLTPEGATHAKSATVPDVEAPFVILRRCLPVMGDPMEIALQRNQGVDIQFVWMGIPDTSGRVMAMGRRGDLSL